ncbi:MAG: hypothetical protein U0441_31695 [Polyangiaceae bacterium]
MIRHRAPFRSSIGPWLRPSALLLASSMIASAALAQPAPTASAQPTASPSAQPAAPSKEDRQRANDLMDQGDEDAKKGDLSSALARYQEAHAIMHVPSTGIEVARALDKLGKLMEALAAAREVAAMPPVAMPGGASEPKAFTEARDAAKALVTELEARVPTLTIVVTGVPGRTPVEVTLDGRKLTSEELAAPLTLPPGKYHVIAKADEHTPAFADIVLKERDRAQATLALAHVLVIAPDPTPTHTAPPPPPPPKGVSPLVPAGFTIAGVGLLAGAITGALALSAAGEANTRCPKGLCPDESVKAIAQSKYGTADTLAIVSDIGFVVAVGGAVLGMYGLANPPKAAAPAKPSATLLVGPTSAGVRFQF